MMNAEKERSRAPDFPDLRGVVPTVLTPFNDDLSVDFDSIRRLIDDYARNGVGGILVPVVAGQTHLAGEEDFLHVSGVPTGEQSFAGDASLAALLGLEQV